MLKSKSAARPPRQAAFFIEPLETRITPGGVSFPHVLSINRAASAPIDTAAGEVTYTVTFDQVVSGVDASDFKIFTSVDAKTIPPLTVTPSGSSNVFTVKVSGLHGNGDVRLDLVDDDSISAGPLALGGAGASNGSFTGQTYHLLQARPKVDSINVTATGAGSVTWTVTFSESVTGVDKTDFAPALSGTTVANPLVVTPVAASNGASYTVTASGITGTGTIGLNLLDDDGTIKDSDNNRLQTAPVSFGQPQTTGAGVYPIAIASGDLNGDGKPDLALLNNYYDSSAEGYTVSVLLGNGDGSFQAKRDFSVGDHPREVAIADVNGDGMPDLIVTGQTYYSETSTTHFVSVLLGVDSDHDGHGDTFQDRQDFGNNVGSAGAVAVGDMNHDGKPDLVVLTTSEDSAVNVLLGNGDGSFQSEQTFPVGISSNDVQIADVNGDGVPDVVTANYLDGSVSVLIGNNAGGLGTAERYSIAGSLTFSNPKAVAVGDMNGDGIPDLVTAGRYSYFYAGNSYTGGMVTVMLGDGSGTFAASTQDRAGQGLSDVQLADFNGDGKLDIAVSDGRAPLSEFDFPVYVLLGAGDGTVSERPRGFATSDTTAASLTVADFNGDGKADLATTNGTAFSTFASHAEVASEAAAMNGTTDALLNIGTGAFTGEVFTVAVDAAITSISDGKTSAETSDALTFTIDYANHGVLGATGVTLAMPLDSHLFFVASENPGWSEYYGTLTKTLPGTLAGGATGTESLKLHVKHVLNSAYSSSIATVTISDDGTHGSDSNSTNNSASDYDTLTGQVYSGFVVTAPGVSPQRGVFALPVVRIFDRVTGAEVYSFSAYESTYRDSIRVAVGDLNNDGIDDIVTTTQHYGGRMRVFDGATGTMFTDGPLSEEIPIFGLNKAANKNKGAFVAVGDVNGTGAPEIVVGSSLISPSLGGGTVKVFSIDGGEGIETIKEFTPFGPKFKGGVRVAVADVDYYGIGAAVPGNFERPSPEGDIIVGQGARGATVKVYKGTVIHSAVGQEETFKLGEFKVGARNFTGGVSVAADDINGDGHADIIVGRNTGKPSVVEIFDGAAVLSGGTITPVNTLNPFDTDPKVPKNSSGVRVATVADITGDGIADIIASVGIKQNSLIKFYDGAAFLAGTIKPLETRTVTAFNAPFLDVALWIAASRGSVTD